MLIVLDCNRLLVWKATGLRESAADSWFYCQLIGVILYANNQETSLEPYIKLGWSVIQKK